jgi:alpha-galactosidase
MLGNSWRHPQGWQAVVRHSADQMLVVLHTFAGAPEEVSIPLPGAAEHVESFPGLTATVEGDQLRVKILGDFTGAVFLLNPR